MLQLVKVVKLLLIYFVPFGITLTYDQVKSALPERPSYGGVLGKYLQYPGLRYEPNIPSFENLVLFNSVRPSTYGQFVDHVDSILSKYKPQYINTEEFLDCEHMSEYRPPDTWNTGCLFNVTSQLGADCVKYNSYGYEDGQPCFLLSLDRYKPQYINTEEFLDCEHMSEYRPPDTWNTGCLFNVTSQLGADCVKYNSYGYEDGQPCFLLSLDRILNWLPEPYTNETVPDKIRGEWSMYSVTVHCEGEDPVSKDNIGTITYYPKHGFHFKYFPYTGERVWLNPLVFVRLEDPNPAVVLRVTCSVYAKNIVQYDNLDTGKVSFDVMVD